MAWEDRVIEYPRITPEPQTLEQFIDTLKALGIVVETSIPYPFQTLYYFDRDAFDAKVGNFNFVLRSKSTT